MLELLGIEYVLMSNCSALSWLLCAQNLIKPSVSECKTGTKLPLTIFVHICRLAETAVCQDPELARVTCSRAGICEAGDCSRTLSHGGIEIWEVSSLSAGHAEMYP